MAIAITFINSADDGRQREMEVANGTTPEELFNTQVGKDISKYVINVNRMPSQGIPLSPGDRVTVAPAQMKGGRL